MVSHQMTTFVNKPLSAKTGCKLLGIEGYFLAGTKNPAELTNLCRLVLRANDNINGKKLNLTANIPVAEIPAILELSRLAFDDFATNKKALNFPILEGLAKPKESDENDEGTLVYSVEILYNPKQEYPITINVKNFRADVTTDAEGRLKYSRPKGATQTIGYYLPIRTFYNSIAHLNNMYQAWCAKAAINGEFNGAL